MTMDTVPADRSTHNRQRRLATLIFFQMLPATLLSPAIRPLFVQFHAGDEALMHAFMAVNMLGAVLFVPWIAARADRLTDASKLLTGLIVADSLLLASLTLPVAATALLGLRALEGVAHVGATSMLLAEMARHREPAERARAMGMAGGALMLAVALGSALGGLLVPIDPRLPFWLGCVIQAGVAVAAHRMGAQHMQRGARSLPAVPDLTTLRPLLVPLFAVFVGRFTVGCLVVTFALFAHRAHGISDRAIGLLFSLVTLPFAAAMYPCARLAERVPRALLLSLGAVIHAAALFMLGRTATAWLPFVMVVMGVASALLFSPTLCYAGERGEAGRQKRMALLNSAGCLGMVVGPMVAGITSSIAGRVDPVVGYQAVFTLASASVVAWLAASTPWLLARARIERAELRSRWELPRAGGAPPMSSSS